MIKLRPPPSKLLCTVRVRGVQFSTVQYDVLLEIQLASAQEFHRGSECFYHGGQSFGAANFGNDAIETLVRQTRAWKVWVLVHPKQEDWRCAFLFFSTIALPTVCTLLLKAINPTTCYWSPPVSCRSLYCTTILNHLEFDSVLEQS
jgi:hypothetical protein